MINLRPNFNIFDNHPNYFGRFWTFASFVGLAFSLKKIFDQTISSRLPDYQLGFIKTKDIVSLALASYGALKIIELIKPVSPLTVGLSSLFLIAILASKERVRVEKKRASLDWITKLQCWREGCLRANENDVQYCTVFLNWPNQPRLEVTLIYNPSKRDYIQFFLKEEKGEVRRVYHQCILVCSGDIFSVEAHINKIKQAAFGSVSPEDLKQFSWATLSGPPYLKKWEGLTLRLKAPEKP